MRPGDVVTCASCGAQAQAFFTSGTDRWREGYPVSLIWTHGPDPRWEVTHHRPELCVWCHERTNSVGGVLGPRSHLPPGGPTAGGCYYLRDGHRGGCRPTSACWTEACGAAGIARPPGSDDDWGRRSQAGDPLCRPDPNAPADELPPTAPPEPRHRTYLDDRLDGSVPEPEPIPPTQLGLFT